MRENKAPRRDKEQDLLEIQNTIKAFERGLLNERQLKSCLTGPGASALRAALIARVVGDAQAESEVDEASQ